MLSRLRSMSARPRRKSAAHPHARVWDDDPPPLPPPSSSGGPDEPLSPLATPPASPSSASPPSGPGSGARKPRKAPPLASNTHIWHDRTGHFSVNAEFVGFTGPGASKLRLHTVQGAMVEIALEELAKSDLRLLEDMTGRALLGPAAYATNLPPPDPAQQNRMHQADRALKSFLAHQDDVVTKAIQNQDPADPRRRTQSGSTPLKPGADEDEMEPDPRRSWAWRPPPEDPLAPKRSKSTSRNYKARQTAKARGKTWDAHDDPGDMEILEPYQAEMIPTLPTASSEEFPGTSESGKPTPLRKRMSFSAAAGKVVRRSTASTVRDGSGRRSSVRVPSSSNTTAFPTASPPLSATGSSAQEGAAHAGGATSPALKRRSHSLISPSRHSSSFRSASPPPPLPSSPARLSPLASAEGRTRTVSASAASNSPLTLRSNRPSAAPTFAAANSSPSLATSSYAPNRLASAGSQPAPGSSALGMGPPPVMASTGSWPVAGTPAPAPSSDPVSSFFDALEAQPPPPSTPASAPLLPQPSGTPSFGPRPVSFQSVGAHPAPTTTNLSVPVPPGDTHQALSLASLSLDASQRTSLNPFAAGAGAGAGANVGGSAAPAMPAMGYGLAQGAPSPEIPQNHAVPLGPLPTGGSMGTTMPSPLAPNLTGGSCTNPFFRPASSAGYSSPLPSGGAAVGSTLPSPAHGQATWAQGTNAILPGTMGTYPSPGQSVGQNLFARPVPVGYGVAQ